MNQNSNASIGTAGNTAEEMTSEKFWKMNVGDIYVLAKAAGMEPSEFWEKYADMSTFPKDKL